MRYIKHIFFLILCFSGMSCVTPFDLDLDDEPVIFLESFPGDDDVVAFRIQPAYSKSNSASRPEFRPEILFTVNGDPIPVRQNVGKSLSGRYEESFYIADYKPSPGDEMTVEVSSEGFRTIHAETSVPDVFPQRKIDYRTETVGEREMNILYVKPEDGSRNHYAYGLQIMREETRHYPDTTIVNTSRYIGGQIPDYYDLVPGSMNGMSVEINGWGVSVWKAGAGNNLHMVLNSYSYDGSDYDLFFGYQGEEMQYDDNGNELGLYTYETRNRIVLYTMSEEFYKYAVAQELVEDNAGFIAGLAPSNFCYSNVKGGYGAFAGVTSVCTDWITREFIESNR